MRNCGPSPLAEGSAPMQRLIAVPVGGRDTHRLAARFECAAVAVLGRGVRDVHPQDLPTRGGASIVLPHRYQYQCHAGKHNWKGPGPVSQP
jgi:hypothetical protein